MSNESLKPYRAEGLYIRGPIFDNGPAMTTNTTEAVVIASWLNEEANRRVSPQGQVGRMVSEYERWGVKEGLEVVLQGAILDLDTIYKKLDGGLIAEPIREVGILRKVLVEKLNNLRSIPAQLPAPKTEGVLQAAKRLIESVTAHADGTACHLCNKNAEALKQALLSSAPAERDMTPEEALAEARKRWGRTAFVEMHYPEGDWSHLVGDTAPGLKVKFFSDTFRAAFAAADRAQDERKLNQT